MTQQPKIEVETIPDTPGEIKTKTLLDMLAYILGYVQAKVLVDTVVVTFA